MAMRDGNDDGSEVMDNLYTVCFFTGLDWIKLGFGLDSKCRDDCFLP